MVNMEQYRDIKARLDAEQVRLVAVSKFKEIADIAALYEAGQLDFGENYVQELVAKQAALPADIRWHFIGHLQRNKVKYIAPFVSLIHGVDRYDLLQEINKQAQKQKRIIGCLLQMHIATEDTKFGMDEKEVVELLDFYTANKDDFKNITIAGLMGMASFTDDKEQVRREFRKLKSLFDIFKSSYFLGDDHFKMLSMGMTDDYPIAIAEGSTMVRIGRALFGAR